MKREYCRNNVSFMTPRAGVFVLRQSHIGHIVKMHYYFEIFFSTPGHFADRVPNYIKFI